MNPPWACFGYSGYCCGRKLTAGEGADERKTQQGDGNWMRREKEEEERDDEEDGGDGEQ